MKKSIIMLSVFSLFGAALLASPVVSAAPSAPQLTAQHDALVQVAKKAKKAKKKGTKTPAPPAK